MGWQRFIGSMKCRVSFFFWKSALLSKGSFSKREIWELNTNTWPQPGLLRGGNDVCALWNVSSLLEKCHIITGLFFQVRPENLLRDLATICIAMGWQQRLWQPRRGGERPPCVRVCVCVSEYVLNMALRNVGLFWKSAMLLQGFFPKETCGCIEPINQL